MKYIFLISLLFFLGCTQKKKGGTSYDTLDAAIMDSVFARGHRNSHILMYPTPEKAADFVLQSAPIFRQMIKTHFLIADSAGIKKLLLTSVPLDTSVTRERSTHITFITDTSTASKLRMPQSGPNGEPVIDVFYKLITKDGNQCIILIHWSNAGTEAAQFEKKAGKWKVASVQTETLE